MNITRLLRPAAATSTRRLGVALALSISCLFASAADAPKAAPAAAAKSVAPKPVLFASPEEGFNALVATLRQQDFKALAKLLPMIDPTPAYSWSGSFGDSETGTPTIGPIPKTPNCFAAMGYGGNGITFSMMAGQMLRGMITGDGDPDSDLVSFGRNF